MSDTPRTDANTGKMYSLRMQNDLAPGEFARQLERELIRTRELLKVANETSAKTDTIRIKLERELAEALAKCGKLEQLRTDWMETARLSQDRAFSNFNELMASQARDVQLREALKTTLEVLKSNGWDWKAPSVEMAESALSLPPPPVVAMEDAQSLRRHAESILDLIDSCGIDETPSDFSEKYKAAQAEFIKFKSKYPTPIPEATT